MSLVKTKPPEIFKQASDELTVIGTRVLTIKMHYSSSICFTLTQCLEMNVFCTLKIFAGKKSDE